MLQQTSVTHNLPRNGRITQPTDQERINQLETHVAWLTHLCRQLCERLTTELAHDRDDDIAWVRDELVRIDPHL